MKRAMNVKQIARECLGPPLGSLRAQRVHRACRICVHANELTEELPDSPTLSYSSVCYYGISCIEKRRL